MSFLTTVMPIYNGERYLPQALESLATQSRKPDRVVILDDGSTDSSRAIVDSFKPRLPIEYRLNEPRRGLFGNHNLAMDFGAETDYLHLLHQDDVLLPDLLARSLEMLQPVAGRGLTYCHALTIDDDGHAIVPIVTATTGAPDHVPLDRFLHDREQMRADIFVSGMVMKTNRQAIPMRFHEDIRQVGDQLFYAEWALLCAAVIQLREPLLKCRSHELSTSKLNRMDLKTMVDDDWRVIWAVNALRKQSGLTRWMRGQELKCFFAALMHVKRQLLRAQSSTVADAIFQRGKTFVSPIHWMLGKLAFRLREIFRGKQAG